METCFFLLCVLVHVMMMLISFSLLFFSFFFELNWIESKRRRTDILRVFAGLSKCDVCTRRKRLYKLLFLFLSLSPTCIELASWIWILLLHTHSRLHTQSHFCKKSVNLFSLFRFLFWRKLKVVKRVDIHTKSASPWATKFIQMFCPVTSACASLLKRFVTNDP